MKKRARTGLLGAGVAAVLVGATALAQGPTEKPANQPEAGRAATSGQLDAANWLSELMLVNEWALEVSSKVQQRASTREVKALATQSAAEHRRLRTRIQQLAQQENVPLGAGLRADNAAEDVMHRTLLSSLLGLEQLQGANLDRAYLGAMVIAHDVAVDKLRWASSQLKRPALTRVLQQEVLPALVSQRGDAYALLGKLAPRAQPLRSENAADAARGTGGSGAEGSATPALEDDPRGGETPEPWYEIRPGVKPEE